ncbi:MAG: hypothetical protein HQK76_17070 [Desulfobacterales bacterium]|nr:hypothetical protein [Desulfobacterales bacterium]
MPSVKILKFNVFIIFYFLLSSLSYASELKLHLSYSDVDSFPNLIGNGTEIADPPGISVELISKAAQDLGLTVKLTRMSNNRVANW